MLTTCQEHTCNFLCIRETDRDNQQTKPNIPRMKPLEEITHEQYKSVIIVRAVLQLRQQNSTVLLEIEVVNNSMLNAKKPPDNVVNIGMPLLHTEDGI